MMGEADGPYVSAPLTHLPHSHVSNLGRNQPPDNQRAAPVPGVRQAAVHLHPAPSVPLQPVLSKQGLDFLGAQVVPGPHGLLLKKETEVEGGQGADGAVTPEAPSHRSQVRTKDEREGSPFAKMRHIQEAPRPRPPSRGPTHLAIADSSSPHAQAEGSDKGQGADTVRGQIAFQQTPEPAEEHMEAQVHRGLRDALKTPVFPAPLPE